jgi:hypothetical protein
MFSNHVHKIIILPTLVIRISNLEIFLFCQHNSTGGGNLELRQTISLITNKLWSFFATLGHPVYPLYNSALLPGQLFLRPCLNEHYLTTKI